MRIEEYADAIHAVLTIEHSPNAHPEMNFSARFDGCTVQVGENILKGERGTGTTPDAAIDDYVQRIRGQRLVFMSLVGEPRREFLAPQTLYYGEHSP